MKNNISFNSALCKFGIGVFETIRVEGEPIDLSLHMSRMFNSIEVLNISTSYDKKYLTDKIQEYIKENKIYNKALRITVFDEGYNISTRDILYDENSYKKGFKINISPIKRGNSIIYRHKTTNYFESIYTKNYANEKGYDDGLFLDMNNTILECSMSNIFFIKENCIFTPSKELPILNGTMKNRIIEICKKLNIDIIEKNINIDEVKDFDFVFVTNSLMKVMKVIEIEGIIYNKENNIFNDILACLK